MGYGSKPDGGYNEASRAFKADPSIENYVRLRRERPEDEIEIKVHGGIDQLFFMEPELKRYGIDARDVASVLDANPDAISSMSLFLLEEMIAARKLKRAGDTHTIRRGRALPTKLIDWLINCALDSLSWNDQLEIPRDLIVLIRERLGGPNSEYEEGSRTHERKSSAAMFAGQLVAMGRKPSIRQLARAMSVAPSTVKRWFGPGELEREIEIYRHWFDEDGKFITDTTALRTNERAQHPSLVAEPEREKRRPRSPRKPA